MEKVSPPLFFAQIVQNSQRIAIQDHAGTHTYQQLWSRAMSIALYLKDKGFQKGERVAFQATPNADYVSTLWAIWAVGGIAVPISLSYPAPEILYVLQNAEVGYWFITSEEETLVQSLLGQHSAQPILLSEIPTLPAHEADYSQESDEGALIIYTSGTTGKPKGALLTRGNIQAQIETLCKAWEWTNQDRILHLLPLHHIHGVVNVLLCGLWAGARIDFMPKFDPSVVWECFAKNSYTLFMAVPTIYNRLIDGWEASNEGDKARYSQSVGKMRLMISGSAALPTTILEKWQTISGHFLLERYGMTEIGMALSNPLHGVRKAGSVGLPLAGVQARLVDDELHIKSNHVFKAYWGKEKETLGSFTEDGWFKTGDVARRDEDGYYYLLGRNSVDILKTGGYKVSALEIEEVLLMHPFVKECAVVGVPDVDWGDKVVAVIALKTENQPLTLPALRTWAKQFLAPYKVPMQLCVVKELPRNAIGKVIKAEVKKLANP